MQGSQTDGIPWEANMKFAVVSQQAIVRGQGIIRREVIKSTGKDVCKSRLRFRMLGQSKLCPSVSGYHPRKSRACSVFMGTGSESAVAIPLAEVLGPC